MTTVNHLGIAQSVAARVIATWASEADMVAVFERCHRGPKFDRTGHGRAIVEKLFGETWAGAVPGRVPNAWDQLRVAYFLAQDLKDDYNLCTQVIPNLLPVPLRVRHAELQALVTKTAEAFEGRTDVPNPFKEKRPKLKVTAATHSPEVVAEYVRATGIAKAASILEVDGFSNLSFRVTPLGKTPAFSDSMSYGQLPVVADPYVEILPTYQQQGYDSLFLSWGAEDALLEMHPQEDGSILVPSLPEGRGRFVSESGGSMLGQAMWSRYVAGRVLACWASGPAEAVHPIAVIPRLNSVQVIGLRDFLERVVAQLPQFPGTSWGVRSPLPAV